MNEDFTRGFFNTLVILRSYLSEIVIGGGWAPFLYYRYLVGNRNHDPVLTSDIDFVVKHHVPTYGTITIDELLTMAKLEAKFKTLDTPPIIHYEGKIEGADVEIEFLTDQTGSREDIVLEVQKGLSFTHRRDKQKASKDLYYIFDILTGLPEIQEIILADFDTFSKKYAGWFKKFLSNLYAYFESPNAEGPLRIVEQRPAGALPGLDNEQLKHHALGTFEQFNLRLQSIGMP